MKTSIEHMAVFCPPINYVIIGEMRFDLAYSLCYVADKPIAIEIERYTEYNHQLALLNMVRKSMGLQSNSYKELEQNFRKMSNQWRSESRKGEMDLYYLVLSYAHNQNPIIERVPIDIAVPGFAIWDVLTIKFDINMDDYNWRCDTTDSEMARSATALEQLRKAGDGYIYFLQTVLNNEQLIKIGHAVSYKYIETLKAASPVETKILGVLSGTALMCVSFQSHFREARVHGSWFKMTPELEALIKSR